MTNSDRMDIGRYGEKITAELQRTIRRERAAEGLRRAGIDEKYWKD